jgi:hypothetical protein
MCACGRKKKEKKNIIKARKQRSGIPIRKEAFRPVMRR